MGNLGNGDDRDRQEEKCGNGASAALNHSSEMLMVIVDYPTQHLYKDFHLLLCSMTKVKEHSREIYQTRSLDGDGCNSDGNEDMTRMEMKKDALAIKLPLNTSPLWDDDHDGDDKSDGRLSQGWK